MSTAPRTPAAPASRTTASRTTAPAPRTPAADRTGPAGPGAAERRDRNLRTLRRYFTLLAARDIDTWIGLWAEDCEVRMPYSAGDLPTVIEGREALHAFYAGQAAAYTRLEYPDTELHPLDDPARALARWYPRAELADGRVYHNHNIGLFEFTEDGLIHRFTEYFNPGFFTAEAGSETGNETAAGTGTEGTAPAAPAASAS
ncbi:nuclear transport factor 2 family protein [Streptomyces sp. NPDC058319]|uniref:nuclear transport factor 2 family protein n=1 Tax=unclassified Streptomyces TaxID=2593676 RepID=UPI0036ED0716